MSKINKLGKSSIVVAILSFLLVAVLAFGGTYAYFSAQSSSIGSGNITTGYLRIDMTDDQNDAAITAQTKVVQPGQKIYDDETIKVAVDHTIAYYTRVRFVVTVTPKNPEAEHASCGDSVANAADILNIVVDGAGKSGSDKDWETGSTEDIKFSSAGEVVFYKLAPAAGADNTTQKTTYEEFKFDVDVYNWVGDNGAIDATAAAGCDYWMEATITITAVVEVLQADYLTGGAPANVGTKLANGVAAAKAWEDALKIQKAA